MVSKHAPEMGIDFQGKDDRENFKFFFRQHWIRLVPGIFKNAISNAVIVAVSWITFFSVGINDDLLRRLMIIIASGAFVYVNLEMLWRVYRYCLYVIVLTDRRLHRIKKTLMFIDDHQSIDLWLLQDIDKSQHGLLQNLLHFGSITLEAQDTVLRIHFIPHIRDRHAELLRLKEHSRILSRQNIIDLAHRYESEPYKKILVPKEN